METVGMRSRRLGRCLALGATAAISLCHLTYCSIGCEDDVIHGAVRNVKLDAGESEIGSSAYDLLGGQGYERATLSIVSIVRLAGGA